jgi:membrane peptidoglycan carboxypeptidase
MASDPRPSRPAGGRALPARAPGRAQPAARAASARSGEPVRRGAPRAAPRPARASPRSAAGARVAGPRRALAGRGRAGGGNGGGGRRPAGVTGPGRRDGLLWRMRRVLFALGFLGFAAVAAVLFYLSRLPLPDAHPQPQTSYIYSANGKLIADYQVEDRTDVPLSEVPKVVIDAVTSTEDRHFFQEGAINPVSIVRALFSDVLGSGGLQGGSTITQQYVKQAYLTPQRTITRKIKEAFIAIKLEHEDSKDEILQDYLNTIYFGRGAYGIQAAAQAYFGLDADQLGLPQASLLAGLIREPDIADPATDPAVARTNQDDTLASMVRDDQISGAQAAAVRAMPFSRYVLPATSSSTIGTASVVGDQYFLDAVHAQLLATYGANEVESGGLRVTTTLDPTLQSDGYNALYGSGPDALDPAKGDPSGALVTLNDQGDVEALVGGQNYATSQVDLALGSSGGGSGRQAGSTFKAFMLAQLIKDGYSVESTFPAPPKIEIPDGNPHGQPWTVGNFEGEAGSVHESVIQATASSINTVYAQIVDRLGARSLDSMAEELGIPAAQLDGAYLSQVLGTAAVSPLEMADAYAAFADDGVYNSPVLITKVTTSSGQALPLPAHVRRTVLTPAQVSIEDYVLQQVVLDGTGGAAEGVGSPIAGKTGTTENSDDAWFIGFTPKLTTAVWMGYAKAESPMEDFRGLSSVQGGTVPAEIWHDAMAAMLSAEPQYAGAFPAPASLAGAVLTPPTNVQLPEGLGTTTTTVPPTTIPQTTATPPPTSATLTTPTATPPATTAPPATAAPPPPTTSPPTTAPASTTTQPPGPTTTTAAAAG